MTAAFNLAQLANRTNTSGQINAATALSGLVPVANGGTGASTLAANSVVLGNGTSAVQTVAPSTSGNILTSNGTTWVSQAPSVPTKLSTATGNPPSYSLRTWVLFDGIALTIQGGGNASSVTSQGVGDGRYIFNFATSFPDALYAAAGTTGKYDNNNDGNMICQVGGYGYNGTPQNQNETGRCFVATHCPTTGPRNTAAIQVMIVR